MLNSGLIAYNVCFSICCIFRQKKLINLHDLHNSKSKVITKISRDSQLIFEWMQDFFCFWFGLDIIRSKKYFLFKNLYIFNL